MNKGFAGVRPTFIDFNYDEAVLIGAGHIKLPASSGERPLTGVAH